MIQYDIYYKRYRQKYNLKEINSKIEILFKEDIIKTKLDKSYTERFMLKII
jgi:hypothetical protein